MLPRSFSPLVLFVLATLSCGRGSVKTTHALLSEQRAPFYGAIRLVPEGKAPPEGVEEIALLQVVASARAATEAEALDALKSRASLLGCNIVVGVRVTSGDPTSATGLCGFLSE